MLIDSGSTLNLISENLYEDLSLPIQVQPPLIIQLPNGDTLVSTMECIDLRWKWDGVEFNSKAHVVP